MTRDIDWGIPVPLPGWEDNPNKRLYVWFDAVIGYLSASIEWARRTGDDDAWRKWWCDPGARLVLLHGQGQHHVPLADLAGGAARLRRPGRQGRRAGRLRRAEPADRGRVQRVPHDGGAGSSPPSRGVVIYVRDVLARYQPDALRYFISVAGPENQDTDFTWAEFKRRTNDELVAGWGNLVNRTASLIHKNLGAIPAPGELLDDRPPAAGDDGRRASAASGSSSATHRQKQARRRGDADRRRGEQVPLGHRAVEAEERGPGAAWRPCCTSPRRR